jgi:hypothetical protein
MLVHVVTNMDNQYPVVYERKELKKKPEETLEDAAQVFHTIGQVAFGLAAVFGGLALLIRLFGNGTH